MKIKVPATSANLGPGFDCLAIALDLWLEVEVDFFHSGVFVNTIGEGADYLPTDSRNYFIRVIDRILKMWGEPSVRNICITVDNNIPLARGLGSSAAVTVACVKIASELAKKRLSAEESVDLIAKIEGHADNGAAAYYGGLVLTGIKEGRNNIAIPIDLAEELPKALLAIPRHRVRTRDARKVIPTKISMYDFVHNNSRTALSVYAWTTGRFDLLNLAMDDRVHQYYRLKLIPGANQMLKAAKLCTGIYGASISGSGSTLIAFGLEKDLLLLAHDWADVWKKKAIDGDMLIVDISKDGVIVN